MGLMTSKLKEVDMKKSLMTAIALSTTVLAGAASAATLDVSKLGNNAFQDENNQNAWYVSTQFQVGSYTSGYVSAGAFRLQAEDAAGMIQNFVAFCLEPLETLTLPKSYEIGSTFAAPIVDALNALATYALPQVTNSQSAAAFQMAAWEITTETSASYDINGGDFQIIRNSTASNAAEAQAQGWLDMIGTSAWADTDDHMILNASGTQDLLTDVVVTPLPASSLLLLSGLVGAGAVARRRQKAD